MTREVIFFKTSPKINTTQHMRIGGLGSWDLLRENNQTLETEFHYYTVWYQKGQIYHYSSQVSPLQPNYTPLDCGKY